jgi:hypothetical protein
MKMAITRDLSGNGMTVAEPSYGKVIELSGNGTPEGKITAPVGSEYHRFDGGAVTSFYIKESGAGNTGWVAK